MTFHLLVRRVCVCGAWLSCLDVCFFQAEDGIRDLVRSRGLGDVYKRQGYHRWDWNDLTDTPGEWSAVAWLESNAVFGNDNCLSLIHI